MVNMLKAKRLQIQGFLLQRTEILSSGFSSSCSQIMNKLSLEHTVGTITKEKLVKSGC